MPSASDAAAAERGSSRDSTAAPYGFETVLCAELDAIADARGEPRTSDADRATSRSHRMGLVGLALSGGGIRSATFNLGVLQGLARLKLLGAFDYLSTVSGGGYIGSWLSAWIARSGLPAVERGLAPGPSRMATPAHEAEPVRHLRQYGNYLTPRRGALSVDTWSFVATYGRNLLLNLTILVSALVAVLVLPRALVWTVHTRAVADVVDVAAPFAVVAFFVVALYGIARNLPLVQVRDERGQAAAEKAFGDGRVLLVIVAPLAGSAALLSLWIYGQAGLAAVPLWGWGAGVLVTYCFVWLAGSGVPRIVRWAMSVFGAKPGPPAFAFPRDVVLSAPFAGFFGGVLLGVLAHACGRYATTGGPEVWALATLGTPAVLFAFVIAGALHVGLTGRGLSSEMREWWARVGAWLMLVALGWLALFGVPLFGPLLLAWIRAEAGSWVDPGLLVGWIGATAAGVVFGQRGGSDDGGGWRRLLIPLAPYAFLAGLLLAVSSVLHRGLALLPGSQARLTAGADSRSLLAEHLASLQSARDPWLWAVCAAAGVVALALAWRVDLNEFSMHNFYRNRLVRAYIDASSLQGKPAPAQPCTGLATRSYRLADLGDRPYHLINTALNLTSSRTRADWQTRKASSFVFTPRHCGYEPGDSAGDEPAPGYHPTRPGTAPDADLQLGTAIATSGAAVTTSMGAYSTKALAALLTVFNVRLGFWVGNTRLSAWRRRGPSFGFAYLLRELLGMAGDRGPWVYLSDGGHFDNLGVYELVRRRCRLIVACDAGADEHHTFDSLGLVISRVRTDFGIDIDIDLEPLRRGDDGLSLRHCAVGTICYDAVDPTAPRGTLLYVKASLTGDEPGDVRRYRAVRAAFPHEPTADQWFDENQFESYRALGEHVASGVFGKAVEDARRRSTGRSQAVSSPAYRETLISLLRDRWHPPSAAVRTGFSRHRGELQRLLDRLSGDEHLRFLEPQVFPALAGLLEDPAASGVTPEGDEAGRAAEQPRDLGDPPDWLPPDAAERRAGFYFCSELLQLMESLYLELNLESNSAHPDAQGWMNLFRQLAWIGIFRVTFAIRASKHGRLFVGFCQRQLQLDPGGVDPIAETSDFDTASRRRPGDLELNFAELEELDRAVARTGPGPYRAVRFTVTTRAKGRREGVGDDPARRFRFGVGFALLAAPDSVDCRLVCLRIQDHLRGMGLGREACEQLFRHQENLQRYVLPAELGEDQSARLRQLMRSASERARGRDGIAVEVRESSGA